MTKVGLGERWARGLSYSSKILLILTLLTTATFAQSNSGSIIGTVSDPAGAVIGGAKVTITNNATKEVKEVTAGEGGEFTVTNLEPGVYSVRVESAGFKTLLYSTVTVETNARVPVERFNLQFCREYSA